MSGLYIGFNSFKGTFVDIQTLSTLIRLTLCSNGFEGTLPESGIQTMSAVLYFDLEDNRFQGALPESGLQVMRAVDHLNLHYNLSLIHISEPTRPRLI
eukprot:889037-Amphidinium_carterae.1